MVDKLGYAAFFELSVRCHNCLKKHTSRLSVPDEEDAPRSVDELLDSALLSDLRFRCSRCDGSIGSIVSVTVQAFEDGAVGRVA